MHHKRITTCRCCGSDSLQHVLNLGTQPLANSYTREPENLPAFPLELLVCKTCFHNQLSVVVDPDLMFRDYLYVSGTSRTLRAHFSELVSEANQMVPSGPRRVLDLACNDGTLLEAFRESGWAVSGVDPARNLSFISRKKGIEVIEGYWPNDRDRVKASFDAITATNVLAHVDDPRGFLNAALDCLSDLGILILEFPYCREMILRCEWDTIYHEHLSYFLVRPFLSLIEGLEASIVRARLDPIHGGSLRITIQKSKRPHCPEIIAMADAERKERLLDLSTYETFSKQVNDVCEDLEKQVRLLQSAGRKVIGYGASAKGNTLLNRCPLPLAYIVDDNPLKHGYLTPGQWIPIRSPEVALEEKPGLCVLLLAWNFSKEIIENLRRWRPGMNDQVIYYVPRVICQGIEPNGTFPH
jgi:SAM-dependent methyltransferase